MEMFQGGVKNPRNDKLENMLGIIDSMCRDTKAIDSRAKLETRIRVGTEEGLEMRGVVDKGIGLKGRLSYADGYASYKKKKGCVLDWGWMST